MPDSKLRVRYILMVGLMLAFILVVGHASAQDVPDVGPSHCVTCSDDSYSTGEFTGPSINEIIEGIERAFERRRERRRERRAQAWTNRYVRRVNKELNLAQDFEQQGNLVEAVKHYRKLMEFIEDYRREKIIEDLFSLEYKLGAQYQAEGNLQKAYEYYSAGRRNLETWVKIQYSFYTDVDQDWLNKLWRVPDAISWEIDKKRKLQTEGKAGRKIIRRAMAEYKKSQRKEKKSFKNKKRKLQVALKTGTDFFGVFEAPPEDIFLEAEDSDADALPAPAIRKAESAVEHGKQARGQVTGEEAKSAASKVFDKPGSSVLEGIDFPGGTSPQMPGQSAGGSEMVDARDIAPFDVPQELQKTEEWQELDQREKRIAAEYDRMRGVVDYLKKRYEERKDGLAPPQKGRLQVQLALEKQRETSLRKQLNTVRSEKKRKYATWKANTQPDPSLLDQGAAQSLGEEGVSHVETDQD